MSPDMTESIERTPVEKYSICSVCFVNAHVLGSQEHVAYRNVETRKWQYGEMPETPVHSERCPEHVFSEAPLVKPAFAV